MLIDFIHIQNFRKLKDCRIEFSEQKTVFVGANNSGKTTAVDSLMKFLKHKNFSTRDFTLSNWQNINKIGSDWIAEKDPAKIDLSIGIWEDYLPTLDIWLKVEKNELQYVNKLIPTMDWKGGSLGIRLRLEPDKIEDLYKEFIEASAKAKSIDSSARKPKKEGNFSLWPKDMWDFLEKKMTLLKVKTYLLNPDLSSSPQKLTALDVPLDEDALSGLIKIDVINAQRGFSDANAEITDPSSKSLSSQLRTYYDRHLNPDINPTENDIAALKAIDSAKELFDSNLKESFKSSLGELELLNYPGFGSAKINLSSKFNTSDGLNHDSSVQYYLDENTPSLSLPEKYNGLGYQNLISIVFKLIRFRDEWMRVGKIESSAPELEFEPLHLVLIEEPEAHLHAQVQQVFIREAYKVLRRHPNLGNNAKFSTQLVISTHSNHIAHETNFTSLRYFKREAATTGSVNTSKVVNLSKTFGDESETTKFAIRYLKTTHCDLFFADAVILVEGPAERMLIPYFIKHHSKLCNCYISILEIGGSHAHTLKPLIESLGIITLIITDIDSVNPKDDRKKVRPETGKGYKTGNDTVKSWLPKEDDLDKLLTLKEIDKEDKSLPIKTAYQIPVGVSDGKKSTDIYPYTFEDSLVMENREIFKRLTPSAGLLKEMCDASNKAGTEESAQAMYEAITKKGAKKAEFALELFYFEEPNTLKTPQYIQQGLDWLESKLIVQKNGLTDLKK